MEKGGKSGKKQQKIRKKHEIVLKSVFFVVLGDFWGVWGYFGVFFRVFRGFLRKKWFWTAKTAGRPPLGILCRRAVFRRVFRFPDFQEKLAKNSPYSPITRQNSPKTRQNSPKLA